MIKHIKAKITQDSLKEFYNGPIYPAVIALIIAIGSITGLEYYTNFIHTAFIVGALVICPTLKPIMISLSAYVYQVSIFHAPFVPHYSDYYYSSWRLPVSIFIIVLTLSAFVFFAV